MKNSLFIVCLAAIFTFLSCKDEPGSYSLKVEIYPDSAGTVVYDQGPFVEGTIITLTAVPRTNYLFFKWNHLIDSADINPLVFPLMSDMEITAVFLFDDKDEDGVGDSDDLCLDTPKGAVINLSGCASSQLDTDEDGVKDDLDKCPNSTLGATVDDDGCEDSDGDGVSELIDLCPDTPFSEIGNVNAMGCHIYLGAYREGGVVFYMDSTGLHGLIADINNLGAVGVQWGCYGTEIYHADDKEIGSGAENTLDILAECNETGIAAALAENSTAQGYDDWYLPSHDELDEMHCMAELIDEVAVVNGGKPFLYDDNETYWSSTEVSKNWAYYQDFTSGGYCTDEPQEYPKRNLYSSVRAVRSY
ncbi:MAG: DUF1566 domain-containing protein [Flammeovirgaceae bacterium]|nr:DUF1566 domain-containing protein [Flammeovirgaceae bacterium]